VSASPAAAAASVPDEPLKATDTIRAILAQKLKKPIADIPLSKAIEDMVSDKSTLQNELIGDLQLDQAMVDYMQFYIDRIDPSMGPNYELAKTFGQQLIDNCKEAMVASARYKEVHDPTALHTKIDARGNIVYTEAKRIGVRKLEAYIKEMAVGTRIGPQINVEKARENIGELWMLIKNEPSMSKLSKATLKSVYIEAVRSLGSL
ncbi:hypothetical protein A4X06_0g8516, partial [Tilletia controversa]